MNPEERKNSYLKRKKIDLITVLMITVIFVGSSIGIFATKYRDDIKNLFIDESEVVVTDSEDEEAALGDVDSEENEANEVVENTDSDAEEDMSEDDENQTTEIAADDGETSEDENVSDEDSEENSEEDTEEDDTEDATEDGGDQAVSNYGDCVEFVNVDNPDLSGKGDDWYDDSLYVAGAAKDDAYFDNALIIGDSRTEGLKLYTGIANLDAFCSKGLNIETAPTEKVVATDAGNISILEALNYKSYDNIYISFGLNELGWAYDYMFIDAYKAFINQIKEVQPQAVIYVENILPVSAELSATDPIYKNSTIESFNELLKDMCKEYKDVIYLDVASSVAVDGVLPADASTDGRHCDKKYCLKWLDYIRQNVYIKK